MQFKKYRSDEEIVEMTREEYDSLLCNAADKAEEKYKSEIDKLSCENQELKAVVSRLENAMDEHNSAEQDYLLLQIRYDQMLRTVKEMAKCLQYERNNGFVE